MKTSSRISQCILFIFAFLSSQIPLAQEVQWDYNVPGGSSQSVSNELTIGLNGGVYVATYVYAWFNAGDTIIGTDRCGIIKLNSTGEVDTAMNVASWAIPSGLATTSNGDLIISGNYNPNQGATFMGDTLPSLGVSCGYVARMDTIGNLIWLTAFGGSDGLTLNALALDSQDNMYVSGQFEGELFVQDSLTPSLVRSRQTGFVMKFGSNGSETWSKAPVHDSVSGSWFKSVDIDSMGNVYVAGESIGNLELGPNINLSTPYLQLLVAKFDSLGQGVWAIQSEGVDANNPSQGLTLDVNPSGELLVAGKALNGFTLDSLVFTDPDQWFDDIILLKVNSDGEVMWGEYIHGNKNNRSNRVRLNDRGAAYLYGYYDDSLLLGNLVFDSPNDRSNGFLAKWDSLGSLEWVLNATGDDYMLPHDMIMGKDGIGYVSGISQSDTLHLGDYQMIGYNRLFVFALEDTSFFASPTSTSIEQPLDQEFSAYEIFPNPSDGPLWLRGESATTMGQQIEVLNVLGQVIYRKDRATVNRESLEYLDLSTVPPGMYWINIDKQVVGKIILR